MKTDEVLNRAKTGHSERERDTVSADGLLMSLRKTSSLCVSFVCTHQTDKSAFIQAVCTALRVPKALGAWTRAQEENRKQGCEDAIRQRKGKKGGAVDLTQPR